MMNYVISSSEIFRGRKVRKREYDNSEGEVEEGDPHSLAGSQWAVMDAPAAPFAVVRQRQRGGSSSAAEMCHVAARAREAEG